MKCLHPLFFLLILTLFVSKTNEPKATHITEPHIIRVTNVIAWEQVFKDGSHGLGKGTPYDFDLIPYQNQTFVYWSNGSMTIGPPPFEP